MSSKLSSPKHIGKGFGWVLSEDPLRKPHRKRVRPCGGRRDAGGLHFKASAEPAHSCCTLPAKNTDFFPPKQRILRVLQNPVSKRTEAKEESQPSSLEGFKQEGRNGSKKQETSYTPARPGVSWKQTAQLHELLEGDSWRWLHWVPAQILPKALPTSGRRR